MTLLPLAATFELRRYLEVVRRPDRRDLERGAGWVEMPLALAWTYPDAGREWGVAMVLPGYVDLRGP
jgi:hypothetical protein